ncbi:MAG: phage major capsid protein [Terriglobales bacterium]
MLSAVEAASDKTLSLTFTSREAKQYSLGSAIMSALDPKVKSFEAEISQTISASIGRPPRDGNGIFIPTIMRPRQSGLDTKTNSSGDYAVKIDVLDYVDCLRAQMRLARLGATFLPGLRYSAQFPIENTPTVAFWQTEDSNVDTSAADIVFGVALASPRTLQATTSVSRQLLAQCAGNIGLETRLRMDMSRSHAEAFDAGAIAGTGSSGQPTGLLSNSSITVVPCGTNGGVPTYANVCDLEAAVANANASDAIGFLSTPNIRKLLRKTFVNGTGSRAVWDGNEMLGHPAMVSTNCPSTLSKGAANGTLSAILAGVWSELILAEFGSLELVVDQFSKKKINMIEITSFAMYDVVCPRPAGFAVVTDGALI